jgi:hypothetical protein
MSRSKSVAAAATIIILLKRRENVQKNCGSEHGLQEKKKKVLTEND